MVRQVRQAHRLVEENIDETLTFYRLPRQHHKHLKSTNMLERLNEEIKRRTHVVRIFPNGESASGWCVCSRSKPTRTGSSSIAISTWMICASTKRRRCAVLPDGSAWHRARSVKDASRRLRRCRRIRVRDP